MSQHPVYIVVCGVFCMVELPVYYCGERAGDLKIEQDGLYFCICAQCRRIESDQVLRLWAIGEDEPVYLGIPEPEGNQLQLLRRLPSGKTEQSSWTHCVLGTEIDVWRPFSGSVAGCTVRNALRRQWNDREEIALPLEADKPICFVPLLPRLRPKEINGTLWLVLQCGAEDT